MQLSLAPLTDLAPLAAALQANGLPADDLAEPGRRFWRAVTAGGSVVGYGGIEGAGKDVLLRSVVIEHARRGQGHGQELCALLADAARAQGAERLWLLTIDAAGFFRHLGFAAAERRAAPTAIAQSRQFSALCPASASLLMREL